ncbi:MAG TPA: GntR family transcriptional regulator [Stellaceae bacterium]|nr:GntR family transcriptional regulator [Stellaceae bacterium]
MQSDGYRPYRHLSVVDGVAATLRDWMIEGRLPPGAQLKEVELAETLKVSRHSLRAALGIVTREGLVRRERNRGAFVIALTADEMRDLQTMRQAIESQAATLAIERGLDLSPLMNIVEAFEKLPPDEPLRAANDLDVQFHRRFLEIVGSTRLLRAFGELEPQMRIMLAEPRDITYRADAELHRELYEALTSNDIATVLTGIRNHLSVSLTNSLRAIAQRGGS